MAAFNIKWKQLSVQSAETKAGCEMGSELSMTA